MPLPGGPSDKLGNRYELWWTVSQLVRIMDGQAESIRIEDPTVDKAEFAITVRNQEELHQAKRSHPNGKWSLSSLGGAGLLQAIFDQLSKNSNIRFIFVSGSDAPELRELTERAVRAGNLEKFESVFVSAETHKKDFTKLKSFWHNTDTATAYEILQRIEVCTIDERRLEEQVRGSLQVRFLTNPNDVCDALRSIVEDSVHKTIDRESLVSILQDRGFTLRKLTRPNDAPSLISEATDSYLKVARRKLIQDTLILRSSTQDLLTKIKENTPNCVLTGKAGGGKTGCVIEFVEALRQGDNPVAVLAFRLDRLDPVASTKEIGEQLGLEESPALVLATAAGAMSSEAVLVIDQLDAVSTTSGRSADFFYVVEDLLVEAQSLRSKVKFHVVVVCREFDWKNDHRLRPLLPENSPNIAVTDFSLDEVKSALTTSGFDTELFGARQLELLCIPQNLALFLDAHYDPHLRPLFSSHKELFDQYWKEKRRKVNERANPLSDHWSGVIQVLCVEMTASQQLSALKEKLDQFPSDYLDQMASEGVLSFDGKRYGFGHESFFDYCFARGFVAKEESLTAFLVNSEQHLFRRAQVRQVLEYLRDAARDRYCRELSGLLGDERIRAHLKDLAVALAVSLPNPKENEWEVLAPWIESHLEAISSGKPNPDKFTSLVWNKVFFSQQWFQIVDQKGLVANWLSSENDALVNIGTDYVRFHQRHSGDRVAELLEPFVGKGGDWPQRFDHIIQMADLSNSRRFFDLFLRLIDDGTLDNTLDAFASNGTFWLLAGRVEEKRPEWIPEVLAHWLLRRFSIIQKTADSGGGFDRLTWRNLFNHDDVGSEPICNSAAKFSDKFAHHVLPVVLKISDETVYGEEKAPPKRDAVWSYLINSAHIPIDQACRNAIAVALEKLAESKAESIDEILAELKSRETYMANYLLLRAYTAGAKHFANDAVLDLCANTWRFKCGYSDSTYWIAIQLIKAVVPLCSDENRAKLENTILDYAPHYERTPDGYKSRGRACFALLSGIPAELRSKNAQTRYAKLEDKFRSPESPPQEIRMHLVGSPIEKSAAEKMTDEQWLRAVKKYDSEERHNWENPEKGGGALELARTLQERVKEEPERFAHLSLRFPVDTNPVYLELTLSGLKETTGFTELKLQVCRKAYTEARKDCGQAIADLLGSIEETLPDDAVEMLDWLAIEHPEPEKELWREKAPSGSVYYGGDILTHGINTTRGRATWAIRDLIGRDASYVERFRPTVEQLVNDKSVAVRACASSTLLAIVNHDSESALEHFLRLIEPRGNQTDDDRLLATRDVERFINYGLYKHFGRLRHVVERMLRSGQPETSKAGACLSSIAVLLHHDDAEAFVEEALRGNSSQRLGVAQVASANIDKAEHRLWSEQQLLLLFNDSDREVRQEAASCFRRLEGQSLESYENLINEFCDSAAYQEGSFSLLHALEESSQKLPGITHTVCEKFLERFSDEAGDMRTHRALDSRGLAKLILRTYHQHQRDEWASKCLDLIDQMCLEGTYEIRTNLDEYER